VRAVNRTSGLNLSRSSGRAVNLSNGNHNYSLLKPYLLSKGLNVTEYRIQVIEADKPFVLFHYPNFTNSIFLKNDSTSDHLFREISRVFELLTGASK